MDGRVYEELLSEKSDFELALFVKERRLERAEDELSAQWADYKITLEDYKMALKALRDERQRWEEARTFGFRIMNVERIRQLARQETMVQQITDIDRKSENVNWKVEGF